MYSCQKKISMRFKNIVVMADFGSTGLWRKSKNSLCGTMIEYEYLDLSENLIKRFKDWIQLYDKTFILLAIGETKSISKIKVEKVKKMGHELAIELKKKYPDLKILYYSEDCYGHTSKPKEIL